MYGKVLFVATFVFVAANGLNQCDNFAVDITFYPGLAPNPTEMGLAPPKEFGELMGSLTQGLAALFQHLNETVMMNHTNAPHMPPPHSHTALDMKPPPNGPHEFGNLNNMRDKLPFPSIMKNIIPPSETDDKSNATHGGGMHFGGIQINDGPAHSWGISVPMNTLKVELARISKGKISDTFKIDEDFLAGKKTTKDFTKFVQNVDLSEFHVKLHDLMIVCLTMSVVKNDKQSSCQRCLLKRVCDGIFDTTCVEKFVQLRAPESKVHPTSAHLRYMVLDPPLPDMKLITKLTSKSLDSRCEHNNANQTATKTSKLFSNIILFVDVEDMSPKFTYSIQANLQINWSDNLKAPFDWPSPLIIPDYLDTKQEYLIYACGHNVGSVLVN